MVDSKDKTVVWCNQDLGAYVSTMVAEDNLGKDYTLVVFPDCKDRHQRFYVSPAFTDEDKEHLIRFINDLVLEPLDLSEFVDGEYDLSSGVSEETYSVLMFEDADLRYGDIRIYLAVEDPEEYEL